MTDTTQARRPLVPPVLYVPVADYQPGRADLTVDFRQLPDGRVALVAYTALDRLVAGCGPEQPWVLLPTPKLDEIGRYMPYDVILLDVRIDEQGRRKGGAG